MDRPNGLRYTGTIPVFTVQILINAFTHNFHFFLLKKKNVGLWMLDCSKVIFLKICITEND